MITKVTREEYEKLDPKEQDLMLFEAFNILGSNHNLLSDPEYLSILERLKKVTDLALKGESKELKEAKRDVWLDFDVYIINKAAEKIINGVA